MKVDRMDVTSLQKINSTNVEKISDIYQSEKYTGAVQKVRRAQKALEIFDGSDKPKKTDTVHISDISRTYSKEYLVALIKPGTDVSAADFTFYFDHYNAPQALLDAINFYICASGIWPTDAKEFGMLSFRIDGVKQYIPIYAVPKMNARTLPSIYAENNTLKLIDKGYYRYTAKNGKNYTWAVHNGNVGWATSECFLSDDVVPSMHRAGDLLSRLGRGETTIGFSKEDMKEILAEFGIKEGPFSIDAGVGTHHYILHENGVVVDVDKQRDIMDNLDTARLQADDVLN
ncbi:MAG: hypothetical protein IJ794_08350 [Lachnospiraceae bacterium]|nr:hypothetical protein [Lachnospiraceae bacterium]